MKRSFGGCFGGFYRLLLLFMVIVSFFYEAYLALTNPLCKIGGLGWSLIRPKTTSNEATAVNHYHGRRWI